MSLLNLVVYNKENTTWNTIVPDTKSVVPFQGVNPLFNELSSHIRFIDQCIQTFEKDKYTNVLSMHQDFNVPVSDKQSIVAALLKDLPSNEPIYLFGMENDPLSRISILCRYDNSVLLELKAYINSILRSVLLRQPIRHSRRIYSIYEWKIYAVSIVVPLYNGVEFLEESISSIERQTYPYWEVIIGVNGHSQESEVMKTATKYQTNHHGAYKQIRAICYSTKGKENTLNAMVRDIRFDIISLLDVDDYWEPTKLEEQIQVWKHGYYSVVGTHCKYFGDLDIIPALPEKEIQPSSVFRSNPIVNSSMMIHRRDGSWVESHGLDDYNMWLDLTTRGCRMYNIPKVLTHHRIHKQSAFNNTNSNRVPLLLNYWNRQIENSLVTIVTCYYSIKSKFPSSAYMEWMANFFSLNCNMVIYTDKESESIIRSIRARHGHGLRTITIIKPIGEWEMSKYRESYLHSHEIDTEKKIHSPELYMLWNEKTYFVMDTINANPFSSTWFFWVDIGCIRDKQMLRIVDTFPNPYKILDLPSNKFILSSIVPFQTSDSQCDDSPIPFLFRNRSSTESCGNIVRIQGGFFGGHISQWKSWHIAFDNMLKEFIRTGTFIGKDQYIMSSAYLMNPDAYYIIQSCDKNQINDPWFDFLYKLS